ncbi:TerD family protein, partial [Streptomyces sp. SP18CS02]|uniref:TerD family protein n=1 Tax=Streptomyces sp. SP18CS02 TaxID=3002531 RepID=UPI002E782DB9
APCALAASALVCVSGRVPGAVSFFFYNNLKSAEGSVEHTGDNLTGEGEGDDEKMKVYLDKVPAEIDKIVLPVSINEAEIRQQTFGQVHNAIKRVVKQDNRNDLARHDRIED